MSEHIATKQPLGALVAEGKTKKIHLVKGSSDLVTVVAKDDITAGDGAKHDIIPDKGRLATATTPMSSACSRPAGCRSPLSSRTARFRSPRRSA
jgi:phosphoribosylaminoimidazole-succinocarboxamide synthase